MPLPRPSKIRSKISYSNNINVSQLTSNEKISKFYLGKANIDADYLSFTFDNKFEHLLNNDSELDIDSSLTLNEQYLESCEIKNFSFNNSFKHTFTALALNIRSLVNLLDIRSLVDL